MTQEGLFQSTPELEMGAYEYLWLQPKASFSNLAKKFSKSEDTLPSSLVSDENAKETAEEVSREIKSAGIGKYDTCVHGTSQYPKKLRDAKHPVGFLYYRGNWELQDSPSIAVVGTRKPSPQGVKRAQQVVRALVDKGFTIASGLASGIDTVAHQAALDAGGNTFAVLGTPITTCSPKKNSELQEILATEHLVISQVPILKHLEKIHKLNRNFFPERNKTMSALTKATVIVEVSKRSGTFIQAQAALDQGRRVFILNSCFEDPDIDWPKKIKERAIGIGDVGDIVERLDSE